MEVKVEDEVKEENELDDKVEELEVEDELKEVNE